MSKRTNTEPLARYLREKHRPVTVYKAMKRQGSTASQNAVENWFRGGSMPQTQYLYLLSEALGVTCEELCRVCSE